MLVVHVGEGGAKKDPHGPVQGMEDSVLCSMKQVAPQSARETENVYLQICFERHE